MQPVRTFDKILKSEKIPPKVQTDKLPTRYPVFAPQGANADDGRHQRDPGGVQEAQLTRVRFILPGTILWGLRR